MSLYNLASGELKKENNKLKQEIDKLVDTNEDINREFSRYKYESKKEIERLNNIINKLEDSIVGKINILYQVKGQSNAILELKILLRQLQELKGSDKE